MIRQISGLFLILTGQVILGIAQYSVIIDKRLGILSLAILGSLVGVASMYLGFRIYKEKGKTNVSHKR